MLLAPPVCIHQDPVEALQTNPVELKGSLAVMLCAVGQSGIDEASSPGDVWGGIS
jgi:hypothetical protein